ncbi:DNA/RNA polymerase [Parathielavia appendiculata]|uniref:DNA-directed RNA polymerase n=1 Tax=Parathielavia appendiculata TaxID=2587402 RepID=A0AAN6Z5C0_9PEZI|nr:DNA/RNA polymerase [Parathielavia appendiculata]
MLVRPGATRQPLPMRHLFSSSNPLRLSSRCCANLPRPVTESRRVLTTGIDSRPWKKKSFRALAGFERNLATALEEHRPFGDDVPFQGLPSHMASPYQAQESQPPLHALRPFNAYDDPLILGEQKAYPPRLRINQLGIPGDLDEMLSLFQACVQVNRLDRAALVLKRFEKLQTLESHQAMELHNQYLQGRVAQLEAEPESKKAEEVHKWFELHIRERLPITPITIAYMLKTTLLTSTGKKLKARVDRYMSMMPQQSATEPLDLGEVLTSEDLSTIAEICPTYYVPETDFGAVDAEAAANEGDTFPSDSSDRSMQKDTPTGVPEVRGTPQKGMGLKSLKTTLSLFSELPEGLDIAALPPAQRHEVQAKLERDCVEAAIARWRDENESLMKMGLNSQLSTPSLNSKLYDWQQALEARLAQEQAKVEASEKAPRKSLEDLDRCLYGPHLLQSPPNRLAAVTILSALSILAMHGADKGVPVATMVQQLAKIAEEDIRAQSLANSLPNAKSRARKQQNARHLMRVNDSASKQSPETSTTTSTSTAANPALDSQYSSLEARWPLAIKAKVGAVLLGALLDTAKVVVYREHPDTKERVAQAQPAFTRNVQFKKGRRVGMIQPNRTLVELMKREPRGEALARHLPMLVEPVPWSKFDKGGFLSTPSNLIRLKNHEKDQRIYAEAAIERGDMEQMMKGLDVLGKTAWRINRPVFDVMLEAWNTGEEFANLPALDPKIPIPPEPDSTDDPMKKRLWLRAVKVAENEKSGLHSVRCFMNFQLEIARAFRDQTFYFPHNLDFRGRAYPLPTYLNHMGADHMRGLLIFAKGRPLGKSGLSWLKVHLSNVFGFDKASLQEREDFATKNLENIFDSADNPLTGNRWWLRAEDPWQCLATCFELKAALSSPNPAAFVSHLPVHQDGTCNGLQHYAALGGDTWGAQQVNLLPGERPSDVYSAVAQLVQEHVRKDIENGNDFARAIDGKITRKVVKQTVMTNVYGVTFVGAKKQVHKQLDSLYPDMEKETGVSSTVLASYIASKIFVALSTMFRGAHDIQHWLGEIGSRVCRAMTPEQLDRLAEASGEVVVKKKVPKGGEEEFAAQFRNTLVWTTPLRMPVVQPYRKSSTRLISTCLQNLALTTSDRDDPVNRRKQLQAFPPNFIHSLDASHMMLSALECHEIGLTFAAVHDSFWTHAADVDAMNAVIRNSFIRIHQEDVIGRLKSEFEARYRGSIYRAKLDATTHVGKKILEHRKKHRLTIKEELLQERRRQVLLRSIDPEEVRQGREMVTPASIFEALATPDMVASDVDAEDLVASAEEEDGDLDAAATDSDGDIEEALEAAESADAEVDAASPDLTKSDDEQRHKRFLEKAESFGVALAENAGTNYFAQSMHGDLEKPTKKRMAQISLWLPLTFPEIPEKGNLDVTKLKESKYFFS